MTALLALCIIALGFGGTWLVVHTRATRVVARRAQQLEQATGVPAAEIAREIREYGLTPGQWAAAHGLDPLTFRPRSK